MTVLVLRGEAGRPLTNAEIDGNFVSLRDNKVEQDDYDVDIASKYDKAGGAIGGPASVDGDFTLIGVKRLFLADFSSGNTAVFQTSMGNGNTSVPVAPSGSGTQAGWYAFNSSNLASGNYVRMYINDTSAYIGTSVFPIQFNVGAAQNILKLKSDRTVDLTGDLTVTGKTTLGLDGFEAMEAVTKQQLDTKHDVLVIPEGTILGRHPGAGNGDPQTFLPGRSLELTTNEIRLADESIEYSGQSLNDLRMTGWFHGTGFANAPDFNTSEWYYIHSITHGQGYATQEVTSYGVAGLRGETYTRVLWSSVWQQWQKTVKLNPSGNLGINTPTPRDKLDVIGDFYLTGREVIDNGTDSVTLILAKPDAATNPELQLFGGIWNSTFNDSPAPQGVRLGGAYLAFESSDISMKLQSAEIGSRVIVAGITERGNAILGVEAPPIPDYIVQAIGINDVNVYSAGALPSPWVDITDILTITKPILAHGGNIFLETTIENVGNKSGEFEVGVSIDGAAPTALASVEYAISSAVKQIYASTTINANNLVIGTTAKLQARATSASANGFNIWARNSQKNSILKVTVVGSGGGGGNSDATYLRLDGTFPMTGNLKMTGAGRIFQADFSNAVLKDRLRFRDGTLNGTTQLMVVPNGAGASSGIQLHTLEDPTNSPRLSIGISGGNYAYVASTYNGTGLVLPLKFRMGTADRFTLHETENRFQADLSSTPHTNRFIFQNSVANASSSLSVAPNGTGLASNFVAWGNSTIADVAYLQVGVDTAAGLTFIQSGIIGSTPWLPMVFRIEGVERFRLNNTGAFVTGQISATSTIRARTASGNSSIGFVKAEAELPGNDGIGLWNTNDTGFNGWLIRAERNAAGALTNIFMNEAGVPLRMWGTIYSYATATLARNALNEVTRIYGGTADPAKGASIHLHGHQVAGVWAGVVQISTSTAAGVVGPALQLNPDGTATWNGSSIWTAGNFNPASYSLTSHTHAYLPLGGGDMTGQIRMKGNSIKIADNAATLSGNVNDIGFINNAGNQWLLRVDAGGTVFPNYNIVLPTGRAVVWDSDTYIDSPDDGHIRVFANGIEKMGFYANKIDIFSTADGDWNNSTIVLQATSGAPSIGFHWQGAGQAGKMKFLNNEFRFLDSSGNDNSLFPIIVSRLRGPKNAGAACLTVSGNDGAHTCYFHWDSGFYTMVDDTGQWVYLGNVVLRSDDRIAEMPLETSGLAVMAGLLPVSFKDTIDGPTIFGFKMPGITPDLLTPHPSIPEGIVSETALAVFTAKAVQELAVIIAATGSPAEMQEEINGLQADTSVLHDLIATMQSLVSAAQSKIEALEAQDEIWAGKLQLAEERTHILEEQIHVLQEQIAHPGGGHQH